VAEPAPPPSGNPSEDPAKRVENGVLIVDVNELRKEPEPDPAHARPSTDSPGAEGGTAGTGAEHTEQDLPG
jgi:hypothetical protein